MTDARQASISVFLGRLLTCLTMWQCHWLHTCCQVLLPACACPPEFALLVSMARL